jgi:hypothetical protein
MAGILETSVIDLLRPESSIWKHDARMMEIISNLYVRTKNSRRKSQGTSETVL